MRFRRKVLFELIAMTLLLTWIGFFFALMGIVAWQVSAWLKYTVWEPHSTIDALRFWGFVLPPTRMLGVQKIVDWMVSAPASLTCFLLGIVFALLYAAVMEKYEQERRFAYLRKQREESAAEFDRMDREMAAGMAKIDPATLERIRRARWVILRFHPRRPFEGPHVRAQERLLI